MEHFFMVVFPQAWDSGGQHAARVNNFSGRESRVGLMMDLPVQQSPKEQRIIRQYPTPGLKITIHPLIANGNISANDLLHKSKPLMNA